MKALVCAFNQEKALVGAFSVIVQPVVEPMEHYTALASRLSARSVSSSALASTENSGVARSSDITSAKPRPRPRGLPAARSSSSSEVSLPWAAVRVL